MYVGQRVVYIVTDYILPQAAWVRTMTDLWISILDPEFQRKDAEVDSTQVGTALYHPELI